MTTQTTIKLDGAHGAAVKQHIQYGIRFPNGESAWSMIPGSSISIEAVVDPQHTNHKNHLDAWHRITRERAEAAAIDVTMYREQHTFIKRTVVLAVTDTEDVTA